MVAAYCGHYRSDLGITKQIMYVVSPVLGCIGYVPSAVECVGREPHLEAKRAQMFDAPFGAMREHASSTPGRAHDPDSVPTL